MTDFYLILASYGIGLALAAPGGPVNILCVQRTLTTGFWAGFAVGLGAVIGDGLLALIAASGLSAVAVFLQTFTAEMQIIGGCILVLFGFKLTNGHIGAQSRASASQNVQDTQKSRVAGLRAHLGTIPKSFLLTVSNPGAMLGTFALLGGLASVFGAFLTMANVAVVVLALVAGNLTWWFGLSYTIARLRHRVCTRRLGLVNRLAGYAMIVFGALFLVRGGAAIDVASLSPHAAETIVVSAAE